MIPWTDGDIVLAAGLIVITLTFCVYVVGQFLRATSHRPDNRHLRNPGAPETVVPFGGTLGGGRL